MIRVKDGRINKSGISIWIAVIKLDRIDSAISGGGTVKVVNSYRWIILSGGYIERKADGECQEEF